VHDHQRQAELLGGLLGVIELLVQASRIAWSMITPTRLSPVRSPSATGALDVSSSFIVVTP